MHFFLNIRFIILCVLLIFCLGNCFSPGQNRNEKTVVVKEGEFIISINETGEIKAINEKTISAPIIRVASKFTIVELAEEGKKVKNSDFLVKFDDSEVIKEISASEAELDIRKAELSKSLARHRSLIEDRKSALESAKAAYRLAEIHLQNLQFESEAQQEQGRLRLKQAELDVSKAKQSLESQEIINREEARMLRLQIVQEESRLTSKKEMLEQLTMYAPVDGLVVYHKTWESGGERKIQKGDSVWRGEPIIGLPDLSQMQVETFVNEVDVSKVRLGQEVEITLEAFPDKKFTGNITTVAPISRNKSRDSDVKVFDVNASIIESDPILKPGITATVKIIVERVPDVMHVPLESIYTHDGKSVVYVKSDGRFKHREVKLGKRNDDSVIIIEGVSRNEVIALFNPVQKQAS